MKRFTAALLIITTGLVGLSGQETKQSNEQRPTPTESPQSTLSVEAAVDLYKERVSEGAKPTLIIKDGEAKISEVVSSRAMYPGEFPTIVWQTSPLAKKVDALEEQVQSLKKLNAALEQELAACKSNH